MLNLSGNELSGEIPTEFGNLPKLRELYLNKNGLGGEIPVELGILTELTQLWLEIWPESEVSRVGGCTWGQQG